MAEMTGFMFFLLGLIIILLFFLISRVSALTKSVKSLSLMLKEVKANQLSASLETGSGAVSNAVIAAITAAVNQYRMENS